MVLVRQLGDVRGPQGEVVRLDVPQVLVRDDADLLDEVVEVLRVQHLHMPILILAVLGVAGLLQVVLLRPLRVVVDQCTQLDPP